MGKRTRWTYGKEDELWVEVTTGYSRRVLRDVWRRKTGYGEPHMSIRVTAGFQNTALPLDEAELPPLATRPHGAYLKPSLTGKYDTEENRRRLEYTAQDVNKELAIVLSSLEFEADDVTRLMEGFEEMLKGELVKIAAGKK